MENLNFTAVRNNIRSAMVPITGTAVALGSTVLACASDPADFPTFVITTEMLMPLAEGVVANLGVILPIGLGLFSIFLGIRLIPKLISRFAKI